MAKKGEDRASTLLKTMGRGSPRQQAEEYAVEDAPETVAPAAPERKQKTVRLTVDLDAARHRRLKEFAFAGDVKNTEVMRALLDELDADPELAARIRVRLGGK